MKFGYRLAAALALLAMGSGLGGAAHASSGHDRHGRGMFCGGDREAHIAGMIAYAEKKLGIKPEQRTAWTAFTQAARDSAKPLERLCTETGAEAPKDIDAILARREKMAEAALEAMRGIRPAVATLSTALTLEQREKLVETLSKGMGREGHHRRWGHH